MEHDRCGDGHAQRLDSPRDGNAVRIASGDDDLHADREERHGIGDEDRDGDGHGAGTGDHVPDERQRGFVNQDDHGRQLVQRALHARLQRPATAPGLGARSARGRGHLDVRLRGPVRAPCGFLH